MNTIKDIAMVLSAALAPITAIVALNLAYAQHRLIKRASKSICRVLNQRSCFPLLKGAHCTPCQPIEAMLHDNSSVSSASRPVL